MGVEDEALAFGGDNALDEKRDSDPDVAHARPAESDPDSDSEESEPQAQSRLRDPKEDAILDACQRRNITELQTLAESPGGFLTDKLRQEAWPVLLGMPIKSGSSEYKSNFDTEDLSWKRLPRHKDEEQVQLDVNRAFVYYPNNLTGSDRTSLQISLSNLIVSVIRRHPYLHYFQGYHDIAQVFLLVLPPSLRSPAVARLSVLRIRDFMLPNLKPAIAQLRLIPTILHAADPKLWAHLSRTEPYFALAGTLTMYAHDIQSQDEITRLFDVLLAREPVFSVYMGAQIVLNRRAELFETDATESDILQSILSKLPQPLDLEALITSTAQLILRYPPKTLGRTWKSGISEHSVLKTARSTQACAGQSETVGAYFFAEHVRDIARAETRERVLRIMKKYRGPAGAVGGALLVALVAYWLRRSGLPSRLVGPAQAAGGVLSSAWAKFGRGLAEF